MKYCKQLLELSFWILFPCLLFSDQNFSLRWQEMRQDYDKLSSVFASNICELESLYVHPAWKTYKDSLVSVIHGPENAHFLLTPALIATMVRQSWSKTQDYELFYLHNCINLKTKELIKRFFDTTFGGVPMYGTEFNCSINSLGMLFYMARILDLKAREPINSIIEVGGGYGCLARVAKLILPQVTYIIFDLPELLALQQLFLRSTLPGVKVLMHSEIPLEYEAGAIHLIPVYLLRGAQNKADVFVSTFALSEAPEFVQKLIIEKNFFDVSLLYMTGQINHSSFAHQATIINSIESLFSSHMCQPNHHLFSDGNVSAYEAWAER